MREILRREFRLHGRLITTFVVLENTAFKSAFVVENVTKSGKRAKSQVRELYDQVFNTALEATLSIEAYMARRNHE